MNAVVSFQLFVEEAEALITYNGQFCPLNTFATFKNKTKEENFAWLREFHRTDH